MEQKDILSIYRINVVLSALTVFLLRKVLGAKWIMIFMARCYFKELDLISCFIRPTEVVISFLHICKLVL